MTSPLWRYPGVQCGRIYPQRATPQGTSEDLYYGFVYYTYSYTYDYYSGQLFCLGDDSSKPVARLYHGDAVRVLQEAVDLTGIDFLYFCWRLVTDATTPQPRVLVSAGQVELVTEELIQLEDIPAGKDKDQTQGIILPSGAQSLFAKGETELGIKLEGTASNNGILSMTAVPWEQGDVVASPTGLQRLNGRVAVLANSIIIPETAPAATIKLLGQRWTAKAYIDDNVRAELSERPGRSWQRNYMAMHCSKLSGAHDILFHLELDAAVE